MTNTCDHCGLDHPSSCCNRPEGYAARPGRRRARYRFTRRSTIRGQILATAAAARRRIQERWRREPARGGA